MRVPISKPPITALIPAPPAKKLSLGSRGFIFITSGSPGSTPREMAGRVSVIRFIQSIWVGKRGMGQEKSTETNMAMVSPRLQDNRNTTAFRILLYMLRPSSMACTMVVKLSSARIMSLAPLDTSVPATPIATPISAFFKEGASLTPSPVMDTILPRAL